MELGQWQPRGVLLLLQRLQARSRLLTQLIEIEAQLSWPCVLQTPKALPEQHRGPAAIATLEMQVRHSNLQDALQNPATRGLGFMPELLKAVVAGVPLAGIEKPDGLPETGIDHQAGFLR